MDDAGNEFTSLPGTMAEVFFALIAVVIMMLLALVPAIRNPDALAAPPVFKAAEADIRIGAEKPEKFVAGAEGLTTGRPKARTLALDRVLDDRGLEDALRAAARENRKILLVVERRGEEAAFLFDALASRAGIRSVYQLRVDAGCAYLLGTGLSMRCRPEVRAPGASP